MPLPGGMVAIEHLRNEEIVVAIAVEVGKINRHRGEAHVAQGQAGKGAEPARAFVDPNAVGPVIIIVAHVDVRQPVAVDVAKHRRQPPIARRLGQRLAVLVEKRTGRPGHGRKPAFAVIEVQKIAFANFDDFDSAALRGQSHETVGGRHHHFAVHQPGLDFHAGFVPVHDGPIVGHVQVQVAVPIDVRQRHRGAAKFAD